MNRQRYGSPVEERAGAMQFAVARDDESRSTWNSFMAAYKQGGLPHAFVMQGEEVVWDGHGASIIFNALPDLLTRDLVDERLASRPVAPFSGTVTHAGEPTTSFSDADAQISVRDNMGRSRVIDASYDATAGTFAVADVPLGSYSVWVTLTNADGRRYRGSTDVFAEAGTSVAVDIPEIIRLLEPIDSPGGDEVSIELDARSP